MSENNKKPEIDPSNVPMPASEIEFPVAGDSIEEVEHSDESRKASLPPGGDPGVPGVNGIYSNEEDTPNAFIKLPPMIVGVPWATSLGDDPQIFTGGPDASFTDPLSIIASDLPNGIGVIGSDPHSGVIAFTGVPSAGPPTELGATWFVEVEGTIDAGTYSRRFPAVGTYTVESPVEIDPASPTIVLDPLGIPNVLLTADVNPAVVNFTGFTWESVTDPCGTTCPGEFFGGAGTFPTYTTQWAPSNRIGAYNINGIANFSGGGVAWKTVPITVEPVPTLAEDPVNGWDILIGVVGGSPTDCNPNELIPFEVMAGGVDDTFYLDDLPSQLSITAFDGTEAVPLGTIENIRYQTPLGDKRNIFFEWRAPANFTGTATIRAKFAYDVSRLDEYNIDVNAPVVYVAPTIPTDSGTSLPGCTSGAAYTATLTASGGDGTYNWSLISGALPPGLTLSAASGTTIDISGTPDAGATQLFTFTIRCQDTSTGAFGGTNRRERTFTLSRNGGGSGALTITPSEVAPEYTDGRFPQVSDLDPALRYTVSGAGATAPYTWGITGLPNRLTVDPGDTNSVLEVLKYLKTSGAGSVGIAANTTYPLVITVTDSSVTPKSGSYSHDLIINIPTPDSLDTNLAASPTNNVGDTVNTSIICGRQATPLTLRGFTADDPTARFSYVVTGALPPGLTLVPESNSQTAKITGSPTTAGAYSFSITVTDNWRTNDAPRTTNHTWTISGSTITLALTPDPPANQVVQTGQVFTATIGGTVNHGTLWYVDGIPLGNPTVGTIETTGDNTCIYRAPAIATVAKRTVRAAAIVNPTVFDEVQVQIVPRNTITPLDQAFLNGESKQFTLVEDGNGYGQTASGVTLIVNGIAGGNPTVGTASISTGVITYTAPAVGTGTFSIYALVSYAAPAFPSTPVTSQTNLALANVGAQTFLVIPNQSTLLCGASPIQTLQYTATLSGGGTAAANWYVNDILGGNSTVGTITTGGLYTAPNSVPSPNVVTIKAEVQSSPGTFGTASLTLTPATGSQPTVTGVSPNSGTASGGTAITLTGTGFNAQTTFAFSFQTTLRTLNNIVVVSATQATAVTPAFPFSNTAVDVNPYLNGNLVSSGILTNGFTYGASSNPTISGFNPPNTTAGSGITTLTILGTNFQAGATVTFNGSTKTVVSNTPTAISITLAAPDTATAGNYAVVVTNPGGIASNSAFFAVQGNCPNVTTTVLATPTANIGLLYNSGPINAAGGTSPYTWSVSEGSLPAGLTLQSATGLTTSIQGTPNSSAVTSTFKVRITDASGSTCFGERQFTITIQGGALSIVTTSPLPDARLSSSYNQGNDFQATGGTAPFTWSQTGGSLPDGLTFNPAIPRITGTPSNALQIGTVFSIQITVQDSVNTTVQRTFDLTLREALSNPQVTSISPNQGVVTGGTAVTISGANYLASPPPTVAFGSGNATNVVVTGGGTQINCVTPSGPSGAVNVVITNNDGGTITVTNGFTYVTSIQPAPTAIDKQDGPFIGGRAIRISGSNLDTVNAVTINGNPATAVSVVTDPDTNQKVVLCTTPAYGAAPYPTTKQDVDVVLTNSANQSGTLAGGYTYRPVPKITAIIPSQAPSSGGTTVFVVGTGFFERNGTKPVIKIGNVTIPPSSITLVEE